jgi:hypothetical protein
MNLPDPQLAPVPWTTNVPIPATNHSFSYYQRFSMYDEIYNNMAFVAGQTFGRNVIFSNDYSVASQCHTAGFVKLFDASANGTIGKVAYYEAGERRESININHLYGQVIRNTLVWLASPPHDMTASIEENDPTSQIQIFPNPVKDIVTLQFPFDGQVEMTLRLMNISGQTLLVQKIFSQGNQATMDMSTF